jgi:hypothetical protein
MTTNASNDLIDAVLEYVTGDDLDDDERAILDWIIAQLPAEDEAEPCS